MVPDATANGGEPVTSNAQPETDIPGAFPDSDDEQEVEKRTQKNLAQGISDTTRRERDASGADVGEQGHNNTTTTTTLPDRTGTQTEEPRSRQNFVDRGPVLSSESLGLSPDKHEIPRSESMVHHRESHDGAPGDAGSPVPAVAGELPDQIKNNAPPSNNEPIAERKDAEEAATAEAAAVAARVPSGGEQQRPGFAMDDKETTTRLVRTRHLGNEGTAPPPRSPTTGKVKEERLGQGDDGMVRVPAQAAPASSAVNADSTSESLGQYSGAGSAGLDKVLSNGGIRNGVLGRGDSHLGPHLGISRPPRHEEEEDHPSTAAQAGEIEPTASAAYGEDVESPNEGRRPSSGSSGSKKARAQAVHLSGVSEAGLGLGGVHNGVVGHGSHDDENIRHSTSSERSQPASTTV